MTALDDQQAQKAAITIATNSDLLNRARKLNTNFSSTLEAAFEQVLTEKYAKQWKIENRSAIQTYNDFVQCNGCFSDEHRN